MDPRAAGLAINGGENGADDREKRSAAWARVVTPELVQSVQDGTTTLEQLAQAGFDDERPSKTLRRDGVLRSGDYGDDVQALQTKLAGLGYTDRFGNPLEADRQFGRSTHAAVEAFQRDHGLKVDGVAGRDTLDALGEALQHPASPNPYAWECPRQLDDPAHPDHTLYLNTRTLVYQLDQRNGRESDQRSDNLAAALAVSARASGLERIDQVALSEDASVLWGAQRPPGIRDHFFDQHCKVDTLQGLNTPMEQSSAQWPQAMQQFQARQEQQEAQSEQAQAQNQQPSAPSFHR